MTFYWFIYYTEKHRYTKIVYITQEYKVIHLLKTTYIQLKFKSRE